MGRRRACLIGLDAETAVSAPNWSCRDWVAGYAFDKEGKHMAKLNPAPIIEADLKEYLASEDSFALELRILQAAKALKFDASHGGSYVDPALKKSRQFDLRATLQRGQNVIALPIECKSLRLNCPLLVSRIPRAIDESFHYLAERVPVEGGVIPTVQQRNWTRTLYEQNEMVGKSLAQVGRTQSGDFTDSDALAYDKWTQAMASSAALIELGLKAQLGRHLTAVVPCLVVSDSTLWAVDYGTDGSVKTDPVQVDEVTYFDGRNCGQAYEFRISHLHIFTERGMLNRLDEIAKGRAWWHELFEW